MTARQSRFWPWLIFLLSAMTLSNGTAGAEIRSAPMRAIIIETPSLSVVLDPSDGLPYKYLFDEGSIWGEDSGSGITAILCRLKPRLYETVTLTPTSSKVSQSEATFSFEVAFRGHPAVSFVLKYSLNGSSLVLTMEQVQEHAGFELIEVSIPDLATVREEDGPSWLAHGNNGGSVVDLSQSKPYRMPADRFFGNIAATLPIAMVGSGQIAAAMEVSAFMDGLQLEIAGQPGHRHARIGTVETYRVHGGRAYEMNDLGPPIAGNEHTPNLLVGQVPRCRIDFFGDVDGDGSVDWLDGAKLIRQRMPAIPTHYFDDKLLYLTGGKYKLEKEPRTTFAQSEQMIHDVAMLTDYAPQVVLVGGWAYDGQDTGYPAEDKVNDSMGGYNGLMHLIDSGQAFNANVSLNTNYDDAYMSSPKWNPAIIARRPDGALWKSRDWAGETSYIVGMAKYMQGPGPERVAHAVKRYHLRDAILIDAMSWFAIRNDWDPENPASGYKNLVDGRYKVIDEFRKLGVNVLSEQLRYPYLGHLALSVDGVSGGDDPFGGQPVPLLPTLYRKSAIWGTGGASLNEVPRNLFWNSRPGPWFVNATDRRDISDFYYRTVLPWRQLHDLDIQSYKRDGDRSVIGLSDHSELDVNWITHEYSVVAHGVEIASEKGTFCPMDEDRVAFFSREARSLQAILPSGWDASKIVGWALFVDHREPVPVRVEANRIGVDIPASRPIIVYRNATVAARHHGG
jgi:hypothetical protein